MSVYVLRDGNGKMKIGVSSDVERRIAQLQTGNPTDLEILRTYETYGTKLTDNDLEHALHAEFSRQRIETSWILTEWFEPIPLSEIDSKVESILQGPPPNHHTFRNHSNAETIGALRTENDKLRRRIQKLETENRNKRNEIKELKAELEKAKKNAADAIEKIVCFPQEMRSVNYE